MGCGRRPLSELTGLGGLTMSDELKSTKVLISSLMNSIYYFIEIAFILQTTPGKFQLVAIHHGHVLIDREYRTMRGARISFSKQYNYKRWQKGVKAEWSPFYEPESGWLDDKIERKVSTRMEPGEAA
jgi:hypothetical protein